MFRLNMLIMMLLLHVFHPAFSEPKWLTLAPTPSIPKANKTGYVSTDGARIWYAEFGQGKPVVLLHGALTNSNYWGAQIKALAGQYHVIAIDSRGQGRSTFDDKPQSYDLMTDDVIAVMNKLKIKQATIIGWSDGAIIGINMAIKYPKRITQLFAFGANSSPAGIRDDLESSNVFAEIQKRSEIEYGELSPAPQRFNEISNKIITMVTTQPNFTKEQLATIKTPVWIVDGDHEECIKLSDTKFLATHIPHAVLRLESDVSHFALLQDPQQLNKDLLEFLNKGQSP